MFRPFHAPHPGHHDMPGYAYGVFATTEYAYLVVGIEKNSGDEVGLTILKISDPTAPVRTGFHVASTLILFGARRGTSPIFLAQTGDMDSSFLTIPFITCLIASDVARRGSLRIDLRLTGRTTPDVPVAGIIIDDNPRWARILIIAAGSSIAATIVRA